MSEEIQCWILEWLWLGEVSLCFGWRWEERGACEDVRVEAVDVAVAGYEEGEESTEEFE